MNALALAIAAKMNTGKLLQQSKHGNNNVQHLLDIELVEEILKKTEERKQNRYGLSDIMEVYKTVLRAKGLDHSKDTRIYKLLLKFGTNKHTSWHQTLEIKKLVFNIG